MNAPTKTLLGCLAATLLLVNGVTGHAAADAIGEPVSTDIPHELTSAWAAIDQLAAHPADPDLPSGVEGVTDEQVAALPAESVARLLSDETVEAAMMSDRPRHVFALGRVASIHGADELAFELLYAAVESGSAPAHMYIADWYADDPEQALALLGAAVEMGFAPAAYARDQAQASFFAGNADTGAAAPMDLASIQFEQADIVRALFAGDSSLDGVQPKVPGAAPDWVKDAENDPELAGAVRRAITTMYACNLAIALIDKALQENPAYLPETPLVSNFVSADTKAVASLRLETGEMLITQTASRLVGRWESAKGVLGATWQSARTLFGRPDGLTMEGALGSLSEVVQTGTSEYLKHDKRRKALARMNATVQEQAMLDANRLHAVFLDGRQEEVLAFYASLHDFVTAH